MSMDKSNRVIQHVGIVGTGAMGTGIAHVSALGGMVVHLFDVNDGASEASRNQIVKRIERRVANGKMKADDAQAFLARLNIAGNLTDLADCDLIVEAIVECLEVKTRLFKELESIVSADTILVSNTSSIPIGQIAADCTHRDRIAGMHFFNPVPLMQLVEIIPGPDSSQQVINALLDAGRRMGRTPVVVKDLPGFLVNYGGRAYTTEGLAIEHEKVATPEQIDAVMRDSYGFRMGPFELMDLTGMDVNFPVTDFIHKSFFSDPRLRSTPMHRYMLDTGQLGQKVGRGFFSYHDGQSAPSPDASSTTPASHAVFTPSQDEKLLSLISQIGLKTLPVDDGKAPILVAPIGQDCSAYISEHGLQSEARRVIAIDVLGNTDIRVTLMKAPGADESVINKVVSAFSTHRKVTLINDSPGFIGPRIVAMIANLSCEMAQTGVANVDDIDNAIRLGLNYPQGPLAMCDDLGVECVYTILSVMQTLTGDDRYRPSQWLRRRAQLGLSARVPA